MNHIPRIKPALTLALLITLPLALMLAGCGSTPSILANPQSNQSINYTPLTSTQGLKLDRSQSPTLLYRRPNAPLIGSYDRFITGDVRIRIDNNAQTIPEKDIEFMAKYLKAAIRYELSNAGYNIGQGYAKEALTMEFIISGLELMSPQTGISAQDPQTPALSSNETRSSGQWLNSMRVGNLIVEGVFTNAKARRIDAVVVSTSQTRGFENNQAWSNWEDVEQSLDQWAQGIRKAVEKTSNGRPFPR